MNSIINYLPFLIAGVYVAAFIFVSIFNTTNNSLLKKHRLIFVPQKALPNKKTPPKRRR